VIPSIIGRVTEGGPVAQANLRTGDRIIAVDGRSVQYWDDVLQAVQDLKGGTIQFTVKNDAGERNVAVTPTKSKAKDLFGDEREMWDIGARPFTAPTIGDVLTGLPASQAGLKSGDVVVAIDGKPVQTWEDLAETIRARAGQSTALEIKRGTEMLKVSVVPTAMKERGPDGKETDVGRIGISPGAATTFVRSNPITAASPWRSRASRRTTSATTPSCRKAGRGTS